MLATIVWAPLLAVGAPRLPTGVILGKRDDISADRGDRGAKTGWESIGEVGTSMARGAPLWSGGAPRLARSGIFRNLDYTVMPIFSPERPMLFEWSLQFVSATLWSCSWVMALALAGALLCLGSPARAPDIGVANWSVEVADFQVGVVRASPYNESKVTPLVVHMYTL